jgi:hypothetical protein
MNRTRSALVLLTVALGACARPAVPAPEGVRYVSRSAWGAKPPTAEMRTHSLRRITIHHTAERQRPERPVEDKLRGLQRFSQSAGTLGNGRPKLPWADVPYHLYVAADGSVAEGRPLRFVGDSNTPYDPTGHLLIVVEGNFEEETLAPAQRRSLDALVLSMARRYRISGDSIAAHKDFTETLCPGRSLYAELPRLRALVGAR